MRTLFSIQVCLVSLAGANGLRRPSREAGTGKTHVVIALTVAACRQRTRVRFTTAAEWVNEPMDARHQHASSRVLAQYPVRGRFPGGLCPAPEPGGHSVQYHSPGDRVGNVHCP